MHIDKLKVYWKKGWIPFLISAGCFAYLLDLTWLKWGDLIIDIGREMYVPLELISGKMLYRDIFYLYGPFSPYFNALLFKLFGAHIHSLVLSGIITICVTSLLIYKISRSFLDVFFSTFAVLTFLFVFAFGHSTYNGNYNFILPYTYSAIHGIMFSLAALYFFFLSFFKRPSKRNIFFYSIFLAATFLCKVEIGASLIMSIIMSLCVYFGRERPVHRKIFAAFFTYLALPIIFLTLGYGIFFLTSGSIIQKSNIFDIFFGNMDIKNVFTARVSGIVNIERNISEIFFSSLYYIFFCIFFATGGFILKRVSNFKNASKRVIFYYATEVVFISIGVIIFSKLFITSYSMQYKILPVICLAMIIVSLWSFIRHGKTQALYLSSVALFSLLLMMRVLFNAWAGHYGFYILVPGLIVYYVFFLRLIPRLFNSEVIRRFIKLGFFCIFVLFIIYHFNLSRFCYSCKSLKVDSDRGALYVFNNPREARTRELIEFLRANVGGDESLVVFPEGLTINFLSGIKNPLYYYIYLPQDLLKENIREGLIEDMEEKGIDYVALVQRSTAEYGYPIFGKDYAREIMEYVEQNYTLHKQFGPFPFTTAEYGIALFKRNI